MASDANIKCTMKLNFYTFYKYLSVSRHLYSSCAEHAHNMGSVHEELSIRNPFQMLTKKILSLMRPKDIDCIKQYYLPSVNLFVKMKTCLDLMKKMMMIHHNKDTS